MSTNEESSKGRPIEARLRHVRTSRGWSVYELRKRFVESGHSVSYASVRAYDRGERPPPFDYVQHFAELTGARPEWLLTGKGPAFRAEGLEKGLTLGLSQRWEEPAVRQALLTAFDQAEEGSEGAARAASGIGSFMAAVPEFAEVAPPVRFLLLELLDRCRRAGGATDSWTDPDFGRLGRDVGELLRLPGRLGFSGQVSGREFTDYAVAVLHGVLLVVPDAGTGRLEAGYPFQIQPGDEAGDSERKR